MKLGMYTREIKRATMEALFDEVSRLGFHTVQLDFQSIPEIGEELPRSVDPQLIARMRGAMDAREISVAVLNATFNMCTHDEEKFEDNIARLEVLADCCEVLGCKLLTLCTGSRNLEYAKRWRYHPDTNTPEAWDNTIRSARAAAEIARRYGVKLGIEIESTIVVSTAEKAVRFSEELGEDAQCFGVIFDASNLYPDGLQTIESMRERMDRTLQMMGDRIVLAHGKDLLYGEGVRQNGCGLGMIDYDHYLDGLKHIGYDGAMIIHGVKDEKDYPYCSNFMRQKLMLHGLL